MASQRNILLAEEAVAIIRQLSPITRICLGELLANRPGLLVGEYVVIPRWRFELLMNNTRKLVKYRKGPKKRASAAKQWRDLVAQMVSAGETKAEKIQRELQKTYGIERELKTVQNCISAIRKSPRP